MKYKCRQLQEQPLVVSDSKGRVLLGINDHFLEGAMKSDTRLFSGMSAKALSFQGLERITLLLIEGISLVMGKEWRP